MYNFINRAPVVKSVLVVLTETKRVISHFFHSSLKL